MDATAYDCKVNLDLVIRMSLAELKALVYKGRKQGIRSDRIIKEAQDAEIAQTVIRGLIEDYLKN